MAGIESFQQSGLKISLHNLCSRATTPLLPAGSDACVRSYMEPTSVRINAMASEINPLKSSFIRTAVAAEYVRDEEAETRE